MQGAGCRVRFNPRQGSFYLVFACLYKLGEESGGEGEGWRGCLPVSVSKERTRWKGGREGERGGRECVLPVSVSWERRGSQGVE